MFTCYSTKECKMKNKYALFLTLLSLLVFSTPSFSQGIGFKETLAKSPNEPFTFCVDHSDANLALLNSENIQVKYSTSNWLFITCTASWIQEKMEQKKLKSFHFEYAPPQLLNDSIRQTYFVNQVQQGLGGLPQGYTGKNVLIGFVDTGIDYNHPDFKDTNGKTRVLRYWDHSLNGANPPMPYNYGQEWDSTDINNGTITSMDSQAHGTTVTGSSAGNGLANGTNKGMAPDATIVIVQTNFNLPNWTLTVADACDYIFKVADEYNMPAVVNLSVGSYLGSHDGNDPASESMEQLIEAKPGRIIIGAAGNSGNWGKYHCHGNANSDTTFVWFKNNPAGQLGANTIYFDFWCDSAAANTIDFAYGADKISPTYKFRGRNNFRQLNNNMALSPLYDTIYNSLGNRIATIESYREYEGPNFHMESYFSHIDSTNYNFRLMTKGSGQYDLWSGTVLGLNEIVANLPTVAQMPSIVHYQMPDSLQTIVSSWNCSEKIISVANIHNRLHYTDMNGNLYTAASPTSGIISPSSARGPSRSGLTKPDISAGGDVTLSAGPLALLNNPANNSLIEIGGYHVRNGGTSMASPVIAGIAALYLEKCRYGTFSEFKQLLTSTAFTDGFTGTVPNHVYGYGKVHALNLLLQTSVEPVPTITQGTNVLIASAAPNYQWVKNGVDLLNETNQTLAVTPPDGDFQVYTVSSDGCASISTPYFAILDLDELKSTELVLYPNPTQSSFTIKSQENIQSIHAFDELGQEIQLSKTGSGIYSVEKWSKGLYFLEIQTEKQLFQLKLIVK